MGQACRAIDEEGWPAARLLAALAEHEMADRSRRRIERHLAEAGLPAGKTLISFDFPSVPMVSKAQVMALASGWSRSSVSKVPPDLDLSDDLRSLVARYLGVFFTDVADIAPELARLRFEADRRGHRTLN